VVTPSKLQEEVFQQLWEAVNQHYLYPDFNGLDWNQVYDEYLGRIRNGLTDEAFYQAMDEMIFSLGDDHSAFFSPSEAVELDEDYAGEYDYVGIGVMSSVVPERERLTILLVFPGSPAEQAGLKAHDSLLAIDGQPLVVDGEARFQLLRGPEGSQIELTVQSPGEDPRPVSLIRQRINSRLPIPYEILSSADEKRIGYLMLPTFHDSYVDEGVESALRAMRADGQLDGLIIDNRYNGGGSSDVLRDALAFFTDGTVGHFVRRNDTRALAINGMSIGGSQNIPLIVLVGPSTASFGEIFSGVLRDVTRAKIIGETTDGNVEILSAFNFSDGSRAWIAYQTFRPLNNPNEDWEQTGIVPDIQAPGGWDQYYLENDPAIIEALRYFDGS
jgi:C-terminal peptidase prc